MPSPTALERSLLGLLAFVLFFAFTGSAIGFAAGRLLLRRAPAKRGGSGFGGMGER
jgi:hypothetical protein